MSHPSHLSFPKFLEQAQQLGLDVSERTLNYYIGRGLLPKPIKRPFVGADGRVAYLPVDALKQLRKILKLKDEGLKLEQIRRTLEGKGSAPGDPLEKESWQRELVFRFLRHLPGGHYKPARLLVATRLSGNQRLQVEDLKVYQIATLTPLVGEEEATRWVHQFYLQLPERELQKHLHAVTREHLQRDQEGEVGDLFQRVRQAVVDHMLNRLTRQQLEEYLDAFSSRLRRLQEAPLEGAYLQSGLEECLGALERLKTPVKNLVNADFTSLQRGLELLRLTRQIARLHREAEVWLQPTQDY